MSRGVRVSIGKRLKEARIAARYRTQGDLADAIGIKRESQNRFESGRQTPGGDYLAKVAEAGLDVVFILTGNAAALSPEEKALLNNYRAACAEQRAKLMKVSSALSLSDKSDAKAKG